MNHGNEQSPTDDFPSEWNLHLVQGFSSHVWFVVKEDSGVNKTTDSARHWKCRLGKVTGKIIPKWCKTLNIYVNNYAHLHYILYVYRNVCRYIKLYWYTIFPLPKSNWHVPGSNLLLSDLLAPLLSSWIIAASVGIFPCPCCQLLNV